MRIVSACLLALLGCGTDPDSFGRCDSNIAVSVSREPVPLISWSPADCLMEEVNVTEDDLVKWLMGNVDQQNMFPSPLRYGVEVPGASSSGSVPLIQGFFYQVDLWRVSEQGQLHRVANHRFLHEID